MANAAISFDLIPAFDLAVDLPGLKVSHWLPCTMQGQSAKFRQQYEMLAGRWIGFTQLKLPYEEREPAPQPRPRKFRRPFRACRGGK